MIKKPTKWGAPPEWEKASKVHDWKNHVPKAVQEAWDTFTAEQQEMLFDWADTRAQEEEWD